MPLEEIIIICISICTVGGFSAYLLIRQRLRVKRLKEVAQASGWTFTQRVYSYNSYGGRKREEIAEEERVAYRLQRCSVFADGTTHNFFNLISGIQDTPAVHLCDYVQIRRKTYMSRQTVLVVEFPGRSFPSFAIYPKEEWKLFTRRTQKRWIAFPGSSRRLTTYRFFSPTPHKLRGCSSQPIVEYLSTHQRQHVEAFGNTMVYYQHGVLITPTSQEIHRFIDEGMQVCTLCMDTFCQESSAS